MSGPRPARSGGAALAAVTGIVLLIVLLQLWLFTVTMEAWLGGDDSVCVPAALASAACLALNVGLLRTRRGRSA